MSAVKYFKKDGTPYKNQGCSPFEQKIVYAVHMANRKDEKKYVQEFYIEFKDKSFPNGFYAIKSYQRTPNPNSKMMVSMVETITQQEYLFHWNPNNLIVIHRTKRRNITKNSDIVVVNNCLNDNNSNDISLYYDKDKEYLEAEIVSSAEMQNDEQDDNESFEEVLNRFRIAEQARKIAINKLLEQF